MKRKRILHCHSTFSLGGKEARAVRLMNIFGDAAEHVILSSMPDALGARDAIDGGIRVDFPNEAEAPPLYGKPSISRYRALTDYMKQFDLVLSYNWGSMDAVGARRLFPKGCPRLIHHEDGFNADEAERLNWKRNLYRRLMLPTADALVVPSQRLETIARTVWRQPFGKLHRIPNGIDNARYQIPPTADAIPGLAKHQGEVIVGTLAGLRGVKNLPRLVRLFAAGPPNVRLVIVGDGPERDAIVAQAERLGVEDRLLLPGFLPEPHRYIGLFDVFALSSDSEQFPISLVEAMAAGLPILSTHVGDVRSMVSEENQAFVLPATDEFMLSSALTTLSTAPDLRRRLGSANQAKGRAEYDEQAMIARYSSLYEIE